MIWGAIVVCGAVAFGAVFLVLVLSWKSKRNIRKEAEEELAQLSETIQTSRERFASIDQAVIEKLHTLSPNASQAYNIAKELVALMQQRAISVEKLVGGGNLDSMFKAQKILRSPLESSANQLTSVIFSNTVVNLTPEQFSTAIESILDVVERDLSGDASSPKMSVLAEPLTSGSYRQRKFTFRGFIKSITGEAPSED